MASKLDNMSLEELEAAITRKRSELAERRDDLLQELSRIDSALGAMGGAAGGGTPAAPAKRRGRPPGSKNTTKASKKGKSGPRPKNKLKMKDAITKALEGKKDGLTLQEVADAVAALGYKSNSDNFKNVVYQALYNNKDQFPRGEDSKFRIAS